MPRTPPDLESISSAMDLKRYTHIMHQVPGACVDGKYLHWHALKFRKPPADLSHEEWWLGLRRRRTPAVELPLVGTDGTWFQLVEPDSVREALHRIDRHSGIEQLPEIESAEISGRYRVSALMEESIASSQVEGAMTTREVAKEMIRTERPPRNQDERMILNNYRTMMRVGELANEPLTLDLVLELHRIVTEGTLDDPDTAGRFRRLDNVTVVNSEGDVAHIPPPVSELAERMEAMCEFANGGGVKGFLHPVLRAIAVHFWLAYDHPFCDGNGRTARALFYWSMLRNGYSLFNFVSISPVIRRSRRGYDEAFLFTENDSNDITYFVLYNLWAIDEALNSWVQYVQKKAAAMREIEVKLRGMSLLNRRQQALMAHALSHPGHVYTFEIHRMSHNVVYQTARTDLLDLEKRGLLIVEKGHRPWRFRPAPDIEQRLKDM